MEVKTGPSRKERECGGALQWASHIKSAHVLTAPQAQASDIVCGDPDGLTFEQTRWMCPECSTGIRDQGLGSKRSANEALKQNRSANEALKQTPGAGSCKAISQVFHQAPANE
jgi:hypothetical protein